MASEISEPGVPGPEDASDACEVGDAVAGLSKVLQVGRRLVFEAMAALRRLEVLLVGGRLPFVANANAERGEKMR